MNERLRVSRRQAVAIALLLLVSTSFGFIGGWIGANRANSDLSGTSSQSAGDDGQLISRIVDEVGPSVVSISVTSAATTRDFFGFSQPSQRESAGTGFIIDADKGLILTNRHVIPAGSSQIVITLADGTALDDIEVIGRTRDGDPLDVAFLRIKDKRGQQLRAVDFGDSTGVAVGHRVIAIGNALGQFQNTVTTGIISGYGRSVQAADADSVDTLQNLFQTDAAINQGNSGGPLVDRNGKVIAVNTAMAAGLAQNIGFAIPINDIKGLIKGVIDSGQLKRPYLGVRYVSLTADYAHQFNLPVQRGAYIPAGRPGSPSILPDSPAAKAGLRERDIIIKINGTALDNQHTLTSLIGSRSVGDKVELTVMRGQSERTIEVTLEAMPED